MVKMAVTGCSCVMTTRPFASPARTTLPASTKRRPGLPLIGAVVPFLHELPFPEQDSDQLPVHPAPQGHGLERRHRAEAVQVDVDVACPRRRREYRGRAAPAGRPLLDVARLEQKNAPPARREREHGKPYPGEPPWTAGYCRLLGQRISHFHLLLSAQKEKTNACHPGCARGLLRGMPLPRMLDLHLELGILRAPPERLDGAGRVGNQLRRISGPSRYHVRGNSTPGYPSRGFQHVFNGCPSAGSEVEPVG